METPLQYLEVALANLYFLRRLQRTLIATAILGILLNWAFAYLNALVFLHSVYIYGWISLFAVAWNLYYMSLAFHHADASIREYKTIRDQCREIERLHCEAQQIEKLNVAS